MFKILVAIKSNYNKRRFKNLKGYRLQSLIRVINIMKKEKKRVVKKIESEKKRIEEGRKF